jgi:hypothetical protein
MLRAGGGAMRHWWLAALLACAACDGGDDSSAAGGGGGAGGGLGGGAGGGGGSPPPGGCVEGETIVPFARYERDSVFYSLAVDGDRLYFDTVGKLWTAPKGGGDPQTVFERENAVTLPFFVRAADLVVLASSFDLVSVAKADFAATPIATLPDSLRLSGTPLTVPAAQVVGDTLYGKHQEGGFAGVPVLVRFFAFDLATAASREIATTDRARSQPFAIAADAIFTAAEGAGEDDVLLRFPTAGGEPVEVDLGGAALRFTVAGAVGDHVYLNVTGPDIVRDAGFYRVPVGGGAPELLVSGYFPSDLVVEVDAAPDRVVVSLLQDVWAVPNGGGEATKLFCLPEGSRQLHAVAVDGDDVYLAVFDQETRESGVVRVTAP